MKFYCTLNNFLLLIWPKQNSNKVVVDKKAKSAFVTSNLLRQVLFSVEVFSTHYLLLNSWWYHIAITYDKSNGASKILSNIFLWKITENPMQSIMYAYQNTQHFLLIQLYYLLRSNQSQNPFSPSSNANIPITVTTTTWTLVYPNKFAQSKIMNEIFCRKKCTTCASLSAWTLLGSAEMFNFLSSLPF